MEKVETAGVPRRGYIWIANDATLSDAQKNRLETLFRKINLLRELTDNVIATNYTASKKWHNGDYEGMEITGQSKRDISPIRSVEMSSEDLDFYTKHELGIFRFDRYEGINRKLRREEFEERLMVAISKSRNKTRELRQIAQNMATADKKYKDHYNNNVLESKRETERLNEMLEESLVTPYVDRVQGKRPVEVLTEEGWKANKKEMLGPKN